jgi:hypothetical protein
MAQKITMPAYISLLRRSMMNSIRFAQRRQELAEQKGKPFVAVQITIEQAMAKLAKQDYRCALTGLTFYCTKGSFGPSRPSFDRLRPGGPYTARNIRVIMLGVNSLRGTGTDADMYLIARALVANAKREAR